MHRACIVQVATYLNMSGDRLIQALVNYRHHDDGRAEE